MLTAIASYFVCFMFYVITPLVFLASLILLWIEDR